MQLFLTLGNIVPELVDFVENLAIDLFARQLVKALLEPIERVCLCRRLLDKVAHLAV